MHSLARDLAAEIHAAYAVANTPATAGGAGDGVEIVGITIDQVALPTRFESVCFLVNARAVLAAAATLTIAAAIETSADGTSWTALKPSAARLTLTGGAGGSTETGVAKVGVSLEYSSRYLRLKVTPDLSAAGTDTAAVSGIAVFGGAQRLP